MNSAKETLWGLQFLLGSFLGFAAWLGLNHSVMGPGGQAPWPLIAEEATIRFMHALAFAGAMGLLLPVLTRTLLRRGRNIFT